MKFNLIFTIEIEFKHYYYRIHVQYIMHCLSSQIILIFEEFLILIFEGFLILLFLEGLLILLLNQFIHLYSTFITIVFSSS